MRILMNPEHTHLPGAGSRTHDPYLPPRGPAALCAMADAWPNYSVRYILHDHPAAATHTHTHTTHIIKHNMYAPQPWQWRTLPKLYTHGGLGMGDMHGEKPTYPT